MSIVLGKRPSQKKKKKHISYSFYYKEFYHIFKRNTANLNSNTYCYILTTNMFFLSLHYEQRPVKNILCDPMSGNVGRLRGHAQ